MEEQGREQAVSGASGDVQAAPTGEVWSSLRRAREAHGMTIAEVARYLKLTPRQIEAMEAGDLSHLPEVTFARGFIRNYARLLKLDPQPLLAELEPARETVLPAQPARLGNMPGPRATRFSAWPAVVACLGLFVLLCAAWYYGWFEPRDEQFLADVVAQSEPDAGAAAPSVPLAISEPLAAQSVPVAQSAPLEASAVAAQSAPVAASLPAVAAQSAPPAVVPAAPAVVATAASAPNLQPGQVRLVFSFDVEAWVEVRDSAGRIIFSRLNQAGSTQEVLGGGPLTLTVGNAPGVKLVANGRPIELAQYTKTNVARLTLP